MAMVVQFPPNVDLFIQKHPWLNRKLCFCANERGIENAAAQVQEYLTDLVIEAATNQDPAALVQKWSSVLSPQEKIELAWHSSILISELPAGETWYRLKPGEYSVMSEPVLHEVWHGGQLRGSVTRNRYNCLVLNCDRLLIVDVDLHVPPHVQDCAAKSQGVSQQQAIAALEALIQAVPHLGFRVYRTRNGLRYLCTTQRFDPLKSRTNQLMRDLYVDPLYARLCKFQATFRARLTPKPWRVNQQAGKRLIYDRTTGLLLPDSSSYAVSHLIAFVGEQKILPEFKLLIGLHDVYCRVCEAVGIETRLAPRFAGTPLQLFTTT